MAHLRPCVGCSRHVRSDATECPFCHAALEVESTPPALPKVRLSRAVQMAFGAAVATASSLAACGGGSPPPNDPNKVTTSSSSSETPADSATAPDKTPPPPPGGGGGTGINPNNCCKPYGAPPADGLIFV